MRMRVRARVPRGPGNGRWTSHRWPWVRRTGGIPLRDVSCSWRSRTFRVEVLSGQPAGDGRGGDDGPVHTARGHGRAVGQREPRTAPGACLTGRVSSTPELLTVVRRKTPGSRNQQEKGPSSGTRPRGRRGDEPRGPGRLVTWRLRKAPRTGNGKGGGVTACRRGGRTHGRRQLWPQRSRHGPCLSPPSGQGTRCVSTPSAPSGAAANLPRGIPHSVSHRPNRATGFSDRSRHTPTLRKTAGSGWGKPYESDGYPHTGTELGLLA